MDPAPPATREATPDRDSIFENYRSPTRHCPNCLKSLKRVRLGKRVASVAAVVALVLAAVTVGASGAASARVLVPAVVEALTWGAAAGLGRLEEGFLRTHWRHAENAALVGRRGRREKARAPATEKEYSVSNEKQWGRRRGREGGKGSIPAATERSVL